ncbi:MAG: hypothetical protein ACI9QQ_002728, partial [Myxococcota bacterium]
ERIAGLELNVDTLREELALVAANAVH